MALLQTPVLPPRAGAGGVLSVLDVAELPRGSEDNKELSGHLSVNALQHAALLLFFLLPSPDWFQCSHF